MGYQGFLLNTGRRLTGIFMVAVVLGIQNPGTAQPGHHMQKLSPALLADFYSGRLLATREFRLTVLDYQPGDVKEIILFEPRFLGRWGRFSFFHITAAVPDLFSKILVQENVVFVESPGRVPQAELQVSNLDLSANKINMAHRHFSAWNGEGVTVSVKEDKPDTTDIDLAGRFLSTPLSSGLSSYHASVMATMIGGAGNSWYLGKGVAWNSTISSSSFGTLLPDAQTAYQQYGISVQNHSYGVGIESYYGADAAAYDATVISNAALLHVFSSGNQGNAYASSGIYAGLPGFANITGSFKMSKNSITVGAADSFGIVEPLSSKGPAHDGRIKPELTAFGEDGSSGAAALVSGTALLIQHAYRQINGILPSAALVKAILINSADDTGNPEVDYINGFGNLNAYEALKTIQENRYLNNTVAHGSLQTFMLQVPAGVNKLKITLAWNDPPALPNAAKALVNDLDLTLTFPASGQSWQPWILNPFPHPDSLMLPAKRGRDSLNNTEQITLLNPQAGNYEVIITGTSVSTVNQSCYLVWQFDMADVFEWQFPTGNDYIFSSSVNTIRWKSAFTLTTGSLEFSMDNGSTWQSIDNNVNLAAGYYHWQAPSALSTALLRMNTSAGFFVSDTFPISRRTLTGVGFDCPDSFLIYWKKIPGAVDYRLYRLGNKFLEPMNVTTDSLIVLSKSSHPSIHYAVAPLIAGREGIKSYTFNYTTQGVACFIRSFLVTLVNATGQLDLQLGTLYNLERVTFEKFNGTAFIHLHQVAAPAQLQINYTDVLLTKGKNTYRTKLELANGSVIYSEPVTIYYFSGVEFIVYPNPVRQEEYITILSEAAQDTRLEVFNLNGQKIYEKILKEQIQQIAAARFSKGIYLFRISGGSSGTKVFKIAVL
jgi:hypothetical protein